MVFLEISATITTSKLHEFNQSKMTFIDHLQSMDGYKGFTEKPDLVFNIKIGWTNQKLLNLFLKSENYRVFHGAIITLSKKSTIKIKTENNNHQKVKSN